MTSNEWNRRLTLFWSSIRKYKSLLQNALILAKQAKENDHNRCDETFFLTFCNQRFVLFYSKFVYDFKTFFIILKNKRVKQQNLVLTYSVCDTPMTSLDVQFPADVEPEAVSTSVPLTSSDDRK